MARGEATAAPTCRQRGRSPPNRCARPSCAGVCSEATLAPIVAPIHQAGQEPRRSLPLALLGAFLGLSIGCAVAVAERRETAWIVGLAIFVGLGLAWFAGAVERLIHRSDRSLAAAGSLVIWLALFAFCVWVSEGLSRLTDLDPWPDLLALAVGAIVVFELRVLAHRFDPWRAGARLSSLVLGAGFVVGMRIPNDEARPAPGWLGASLVLVALALVWRDTNALRRTWRRTLALGLALASLSVVLAGTLKNHTGAVPRSPLVLSAGSEAGARRWVLGDRERPLDVLGVCEKGQLLVGGRSETYRVALVDPRTGVPADERDVPEELLAGARSGGLPPLDASLIPVEPTVRFFAQPVSYDRVFPWLRSRSGRYVVRASKSAVEVVPGPTRMPRLLDARPAGLVTRFDPGSEMVAWTHSATQARVEIWVADLDDPELAPRNLGTVDDFKPYLGYKLPEVELADRAQFGWVGRSGQLALVTRQGPSACLGLVDARAPERRRNLYCSTAAGPRLAVGEKTAFFGGRYWIDLDTGRLRGRLGELEHVDGMAWVGRDALDDSGILVQGRMVVDLERGVALRLGHTVTRQAVFLHEPGTGKLLLVTQGEHDELVAYDVMALLGRPARP